VYRSLCGENNWDSDDEDDNTAQERARTTHDNCWRDGDDEAGAVSAATHVQKKMCVEGGAYDVNVDLKVICNALENYVNGHFDAIRPCLQNVHRPLVAKLSAVSTICGIIHVILCALRLPEFYAMLTETQQTIVDRAVARFTTSIRVGSAVSTQHREKLLKLTIPPPPLT
jgi:hypothetical protein